MQHYNKEYFDWQKEIGAFGGKANLFKFQDYLDENDRVIDFGCGGGYLLKNIHCKEKIGIDINEAAIETAQSNGIRAVDTISSIPDDWADVVISNHALEHLPCPASALEQLFKKIRKGGRFICVVPHQCIGQEYNPNDTNMHLYTWNKQTLGNLFKISGFTIVKIDQIQHQWPPNYKEIFEKKGESKFHMICQKYAKKNDNYQIRIIAEK